MPLSQKEIKGKKSGKVVDDEKEMQNHQTVIEDMERDEHGLVVKKTMEGEAGKKKKKRGRDDIVVYSDKAAEEDNEEKKMVNGFAVPKRQWKTIQAQQNVKKFTEGNLEKKSNVLSAVEFQQTKVMEKLREGGTAIDEPSPLELSEVNKQKCFQSQLSLDLQDLWKTCPKALMPTQAIF